MGLPARVNARFLCLRKVVNVQFDHPSEVGALRGQSFLVLLSIRLLLAQCAQRGSLLVRDQCIHNFCNLAPEAGSLAFLRRVSHLEEDVRSDSLALNEFADDVNEELDHLERV